MEGVHAWQFVLPAFFLVALAIMFLVVFRGAPRRFGPRTFLPRELAPAQERRIEVLLLQGQRDWAVRAYASMTGADTTESAYAIDHWAER